MGFPGGTSGKESVCQGRRCKRHSFDPWVGKIWSRKWQPTLVFLPGKFHGQRSLAGYSPWSYRELNMTEQTHKIYIKNTHKTIMIKVSLSYECKDKLTLGNLM